MEQPLQPVVILSCRVLENVLAPHVRDGTTVIYMDYGLHRRPDTMARSLQEQLDELPEPSTVLVGYGLCGGGLAGLHAGPHTLLIPRSDDCIAILLGSRAAYMEAFENNPGTYYMTKGWLESGNHPLAEYKTFAEVYGAERAERMMNMMYRNYSRLCFIAVDPADFDTYGPLAREVAAFCQERWDMEYEERLGSNALVQQLLAAPADIRAAGDDLVVVPPGGTVTAEMFRPA